MKMSRTLFIVMIAVWSLVTLALIFLVVVLANGGTITTSRQVAQSDMQIAEAPNKTETPTSKAEPTLAPTPEPTLEPTPEPTEKITFNLSGHGDSVQQDVYLADTINIAHFTHSGDSNFAVFCYTDGDKDLLINEIGSYDGYVPIYGAGPHMIEIQADGNWNIDTAPVEKVFGNSFSGTGSYVTGLFDAGDNNVWSITNSGDSNFAVWGLTSDGKDLLVNEIGNYSGEVVFQVPGDSLACFIIESDGDWTIDPSN